VNNRRDAPRGSSWTSWSLSILLHLALVAVAAGIWYWNQRTRPPERLQIEGSVVTPEQLTAMPPAAEPVQEPVEEPPPEPPATEEEPPPPEEPPPEEPPPEEDLAQQQAEAERLVQEQRLAEERLAAERAEQARQQAEREKTERERRERERAERERAERERAEKEKAERERLARERAERERREREQAELARRESELAQQLEAEQQRAAARNSAQARQYADLIRARVERAWVRPPTARVGLECEVRVTQVPGGAVTGVRIGRCNGDDSVRQSIEAAVYRASPLPQPSDPALFERELIFNFAPRD
jgi:colicin import membrane protein